MAETDAMRDIAEILEELPDDESRARVLRWCQEHFPSPVRPSPPHSRASDADDRQRPTGPSGGQESDPALTIGEDVFDAPLPKGHQVHCDDTIDHFEDEPMACTDDDLSVDAFEPASRQPEAQRPANGGLGLESALSDFVAAFQRLAVAFA